MRYRGRWLSSPSLVDTNQHLFLVYSQSADKENGVASAGPSDFASCLMSGRSTKVLVLLDFGLCIDMARFPGETVFKVDKERSEKRSFPCIEMLTGRPWTYQVIATATCVSH